MVEIRCDSNGQRGHLLAHVENGEIAILCVKCKQWHRIPVAELVRTTVLDLRCHSTEQDGEKRLLW